MVTKAEYDTAVDDVLALVTARLTEDWQAIDGIIDPHDADRLTAKIFASIDMLCATVQIITASTNETPIHFWRRYTSLLAEDHP